MNIPKKVKPFRLFCSRCRRCLKQSVITCAAVCIFTVGVFLHLTFKQTTNEKTATQGIWDTPIIKGTAMSHISLKVIEEIVANYTNHTATQDAFKDSGLAYQIYNPGCQIPLYDLGFVEYELKNTKNAVPESCGRRAVFLRKSINDANKIIISIYESFFQKTTAQNYSCCYRYVKNYTKSKAIKIQYTTCVNIKNAEIITLESDFINVKCVEFNAHNESRMIYEDFYAFAKKQEKENITLPERVEKYNVLMLGIDSMSLTHFTQTFSRSFDFVKDNYWLPYPGFHKTGDTKLENLIASLTGCNFTTFNQTCFGKIDSCNDQFIWSRFKEAGYVTAYGEDYLTRGETFSDTFKFYKQPTDHYLKHLFYNYEYDFNDKGLVCCGQVPSSQQLLDYALDFVNTYRNDNFFGLFWVNSFMKCKPNNSDKILENFLNSLSYTGVLKNTFVILFSSHGVRFGDLRLKVGGYYEDRLPLLYVSSPWKFRTTHVTELRYAALNQMSLVTHYDLYNTLVSIGRWSYNMATLNYSTACEHCVSIYEPMPWTRTCDDVVIGQKWCSCHNLYPLDIQDSEGIKSVFFAVAHLNSIVLTIRTKNCWKCAKLSLSKVVRIHFYYVNSLLFYVVAFSVTPSNATYEAVVSKNRKKLSMVGEVSHILPYQGNGSCTLRRSDRLRCACKLLDDCQNSSL